MKIRGPGGSGPRAHTKNQSTERLISIHGPFVLALRFVFGTFGFADPLFLRRLAYRTLPYPYPIFSSLPFYRRSFLRCPPLPLAAAFSAMRASASRCGFFWGRGGGSWYELSDHNVSKRTHTYVPPLNKAAHAHAHQQHKTPHPHNHMPVYPRTCSSSSSLSRSSTGLSSS